MRTISRDISIKTKIPKTEIEKKQVTQPETEPGTWRYLSHYALKKTMGDAQGRPELSRGQTPETDKSQRSSSLQSNKSEGHQSRKEKHEKERRALQADGWITTDQTTPLINLQDQENDHHQNGMNTPQDQEDDHHQSGTNEETATRNRER